ncbi:MAG: sugar phosphate isomerase/epimerase [Clostridia bacterium]|nr:sugar phosphate isomerase/epimerase [Clostridia bacterium]
MKTCVTSYSYSRVMNKLGMLGAMDHAKSIGVDGFEIAGFSAPEGKTALEYAAELREYSEKIGLPIVAYSIGGNLLAEDQSAEVARLCGEVDIAKTLGAPVMRHDAAGRIPDWFKGVRSFGTVLPIIAEGTRKVTEYAKSVGVRTCTENHGFFVQDSDRILRLIEEVNDTNYGALCDIGNFLCADDNSPIAVGKVAPLAFHVHVKDFLVKDGNGIDPGAGWFRSRAGTYLRGTIAGHGAVPLKQDLDILKSAGYDGYVSLEFEGMEDTLEAITIGVNNIRRFI